jgi:hypothetical protein
VLVNQINVQSAHAVGHSLKFYKAYVLARNYAAQPIYPNPYIARVIIAYASRYLFTGGRGRGLACILFFAHPCYYYGGGKS